jgi:hypothetical protein
MLTQPTALSTVSSNTILNHPTTELTATGGTVAISVAGNGTAITAVNLNVTGAGAGGAVNFQQNFNSTTTTFTPQPSSGPTVLYSAVVVSPVDGSVRQILFANSNYPLFSLSYTTLGVWEYDASGLATSGVGGAYAAGVATRANDLPTTGTANYTGGMIGRYVDGTTSWAVTANAQSMADFGAHTVSLTTSSSMKATAGGSPMSDPLLNITSGLLIYPAGTNQLSGNLMTAGGMQGPASARFFGPGAKELGGTFFVTNGGTQQMNGAFGLHR